MEIQLHHPLHITRNQRGAEKGIQEWNQEVFVSLCTIHVDFVIDVYTDHGVEGQ